MVAVRNRSFTVSCGIGRLPLLHGTQLSTERAKKRGINSPATSSVMDGM